MVLADSRQITGVRRYSGTHQHRPDTFTYRTITVYGHAFQRSSASIRLSHCPTGQQPGPHTPLSKIRQNLHVTTPTTPHPQPLPGITCAWFSLIRFRSPLLTESRLFSLPTGTEMFHVPTFPPHTYFIQHAVTPHNGCWVTPFGHPGITARLTAPPGLSRPPTSFIGS